jgi:AraC-like DNA-binding protein
MPLQQTRPLAAHPAFAASSLDRLAEAVQSQLGAKLVKLPKHDRAIDARANRVKLRQSELWYCAYGMPLTLKLPHSNYVRVQFQRRGIAATWMGKDMVAVTDTQACISSGAVDIDFAADYEQVVWLVPQQTLAQKLAAMTGRPLRSGLDFDAALDLTEPRAANLKPLLDCLLQAVDMTGTAPSPTVLVELEQAFMASFLAASHHGGRSLLDNDAPRTAPWQVRRVENYIEANWNRSNTIEDLVAVSGTSARTLFRTFKQSRGCSPLEFARRLRLENARRLLENPTASTTVTEVASACGFNDLGRFSKDFAGTFGELPSAVLSRNKGAVRAVG